MVEYIVIKYIVIKYIKLVIDKPISGAYNRQSVVSVMLIYYI